MFELYQKYFHYLCTIHPSLLHEDVAGGEVFQLASLDEALGNTRSVNVDKGYLFLLIQPTWRLSDTEGEQHRQLTEGGFVIARHYDERSVGSNDYVQAIQSCEVIALDFATKMIADSRVGHPLFHYSIDHPSSMGWTASIADKVGDGTYAGWICLFEFNTLFPNCLSAHIDDAWKVATPHAL